MTSLTTMQTAATQHALQAATSPDTSPGPNLRVGCVILSSDDDVLAEGHHRGAGGAYAEVGVLANLAATGASAQGTTVLITLEPYNRQGRTGPRVQAPLDVGVVEVIYTQDDPAEQVGGDAATLEAGGVWVRCRLCVQETARLSHPWPLAVTHGRPMVTWKLAVILNGRIVAADSTGQWITPMAARHNAHRLRHQCDTVMVGTGTALANDPALTVCGEAGQPTPIHLQPPRVVVGSGSLPPTTRVLVDDRYLLLPDHDPHAVLVALAEHEVRHVLLEGGPALTTALLRAGLVDRIIAYTAPALLGAGSAVLADFGAATIIGALRLHYPHVEVLGTGNELIARLCGDPEADDIPIAHIHTEENH